MDIVTSFFKTIGTLLRPIVFKRLSKKDPKIAKLIQDLKKSEELSDKLHKGKKVHYLKQIKKRLIEASGLLNKISCIKRDWSQVSCGDAEVCGF